MRQQSIRSYHKTYDLRQINRKIKMLYNRFADCIAFLFL